MEKKYYKKDAKILESLTAMETDALIKQLNKNIDNMVETKKKKAQLKKEIGKYFEDNKKEGRRK